VPVERAGNRIAQRLEQGDTVAILADHHADHRGLPVTFLGLPTTAMRTVGLLAQHYGASVAVAGIRRIGRAFHFEIVVSGILHRHEWDTAADPAAHITDFYLRALERIILADPAQYLWTHARWGAETARRFADSRDVGEIDV
jgi:KDO2-lipid IV(A) lauroyltransferase